MLSLTQRKRTVRQATNLNRYVNNCAGQKYTYMINSMQNYARFLV